MENSKRRRSNIGLSVLCLLVSIVLLGAGMFFGAKYIQAHNGEETIELFKYLGVVAIVTVVFTNVLLVAAIFPIKAVSERNGNLWAYLMAFEIALVLLDVVLVVAILKYPEVLVFKQALLFACSLTVIVLLIALITYFNRPEPIKVEPKAGLWVYLTGLALALGVLVGAIIYGMSKVPSEEYRLALFLVSILCVFTILLAVIAKVVSKNLPVEQPKENEE